MPFTLRFRTMLISLLAVIAAVWLSLCVVLYLFQDQLIFQPTRMLTASPDAIGLEYEDVTLRSTEDIRLHGWYIPANAARGVVLFLHGNAGNIAHRLATLELLHQVGLSTFIIDYRGYGDSEGKPSERGTYADAESAWNYLTMERGIKSDNIVIFGRSLGGAVAAWLATRVKPGGVILESTFTSLEQMAQEHYPYVPVSLLLRHKYPVRDYLPAINAPLLLIHSENDEIVSFSHAKTLYSAASGARELKIIHGTHNDAFMSTGDDYIDLWKNFTSRILN